MRMREWAEGPDGLFAIIDAIDGRYWLELKALTTTPEEKDEILARAKALADIRRVMKAALAEGTGAQALIEKLSKRSA